MVTWRVHDDSLLMMSVTSLHKVAAEKSLPTAGFIAAILSGMHHALNGSVVEITRGQLVFSTHQTG